jgi:multidrug efflux pump subunit AcrA (membrane-fusion protein)
VMVVDDDNKVVRRAVKLGSIEGDMTVIREGVAAGERVVTSGLQKVRPGAAVRLPSDGTGQPSDQTKEGEIGDQE